MLRELHKELGIPDNYGAGGGPPSYDEADDLVEVGLNLVGRMQQLTPLAARQWRAMASAAEEAGIALMLVSGFRSVDYQARLIRKKINAGQSIDEILCVNAAPGFSEHHTGQAVDIATPGSRPLTEEFEQTPAFQWLTENAETYSFSMTYFRDDPWGFIYEPWHWSLKTTP